MMPQHQQQYRNGGPQIDSGGGTTNNYPTTTTTEYDDDGNDETMIGALSERLLPEGSSLPPPPPAPTLLPLVPASPVAAAVLGGGFNNNNNNNNNVNEEHDQPPTGRPFHYQQQQHQQQHQQQQPVVSLSTTSVSVDEILGSDPFLVGGGTDKNDGSAGSNSNNNSAGNNIKNKVMRMMRMESNNNNINTNNQVGGYFVEGYDPPGGGSGGGGGGRRGRHGREDDADCDDGFYLGDDAAAAAAAVASNQPPQAPEYRDASFAIAFLLQLGIVTCLAIFWGVRAMNISPDDDGDDDQQQQRHSSSSSSSSSSSTTSYLGVLGLCLFSSVLSLGVATVALNVMTHHAGYLIQGSLGGCIVLLAVNTIALFLSEGLSSFFPWLWLTLLLVTCLYSRKVWYRIPFAASTLRTALECLRLNAGIYVLAYIVSATALVWVLVWMTALVGISVHHYNNSGMTSSISVFGIMFLLVSYHWTAQVLKNVLHVTVSGVVGTWWFDPQDASSLFSPAIQDSWKRATSYSFGSICMGSLLVAIVQSLQSMARSARRNNRCGLLLCIVECLLLYIQRVAKYFNKWAMVYVALYGYDYMTSGRKVLELFQARGWNTIITDDLIHRTISMVSIAIGAMSGLFGMVVARATGWATAALTADGVDSSSTDGMNMVFLACFLIGFSLAGILMSTVLSATDAVIVCLAEAPQPFQENHAGLASDMIQKWRAVYPDECGF